MLLVALFLSIPMYLAWRIVGAPREYQRVLVILLYQCSFAGLALSLVILTMLVGVRMVVPNAVDRLAATPTMDEVARFLSALQATREPGPWVVASLMNLLIALGTCTWLVWTWKSYGMVLGRTGVRSLIALLLFALLLAVPLGILVWAAVLV
jgi:hypothetical protein